MENNAQVDKPKVYRRSSLKCRQLVHKLDPDEILKAKPKEKGKGKRNSVSWGLSNTFEFKAMKAMFQESKEIDKKETPEEKEKHEKFIANRKASIKNEFSLLKEMMKKSAASIIEEENDEETRKNMKKNLEIGKEALKEVSESSEQSKSKNSSKSGSRSGSRSRSKSGSKSRSRSSSKSNSKSGSRSASRSRSKSKSKSKSKSPSRHISDDEKETEKVNIKKKKKVQMEDKPKEESEKESENKETEKVSIKKKRKVKVAEAENESENDKKNEKDIETEKVSIKKKRKVKVAEKEEDSENNNDSEKIVNNKKKRVQVEENDNDEKESEKEPEKINIKKNRKVKVEEASDEDKKEDTKPLSGAKVSLITLKEASNLDLNKIAYITMTDGSVAVLTKEGEKIIQKYKPQEEKLSTPNQKMTLNSKPNVKQNVPQKTLGNKTSQNNPPQRDVAGQNNSMRNPEIPEEKLFYNRFIQNSNNNNIKLNKPGGVGSARYNTNTNYSASNNPDMKKLRYLSNYKEPNRTTVLNNYLSPSSNNYYPSTMPYEANKTFTLGNLNNINNRPNPTILNQPLYQRQQYIRYNPDNQDLYQEPNIKSNYQNYQQSAKYIYSLQNKYGNQNRNNQVNYTHFDDLSNLTQPISPREEERPLYKIVDGIPVKICDNCNLIKHKTQITPSSRILYPFYSSQIIESDSVYPQNNRYQYQYQTSSLNYPYNNKINSFEQDLRVFNSYNNVDEPKDLRNEGIYKTYELKYSKITGVPDLGKLKNPNIPRRELIRPVSKPLLNKRNQTSRFRYVRIPPNNYSVQNYKEPQGFSFQRK